VEFIVDTSPADPPTGDPRTGDALVLSGQPRHRLYGQPLAGDRVIVPEAR